MRRQRLHVHTGFLAATAVSLAFCVALLLVYHGVRHDCDRSETAEYSSSEPGTLSFPQLSAAPIASDDSRLGRNLVKTRSQVHVTVLGPPGETPVPNIGVLLVAQSRELGWHKTDAHGRVLWSDVEAGSVLVRTDRGVFARRLVDPGADVHLRICMGGDTVTLFGEVVDELGTAIAGASIWMATDFITTESGQIVGCTGSDGRFALSLVYKHSLIGAFAPAHSSADPIRVIDCDCENVRLVVKKGCAKLRGVVRLGDGAPAVGARVLVGSVTRYERRHRSPPGLATTDESGEFVVNGLAPGRNIPVWVGVTDGTFTRQLADLVSGTEHYVDIVVPTAARVVWTIVDRGGDPCPDADVLIMPSGPQGGGLMVESPSWATVRARSGPDGTVRLSLVPMNYGLVVDAGGSQYGPLITTVPDASDWRETVRIGAGGMLTTGRVLDAVGAPVNGVEIQISPREVGASSARATVDEKGEFAAQGEWLGPCEILIRDASSRQLMAIVFRKSLHGRGNEVRLPTATHARARLRGSIVGVRNPEKCAVRLTDRTLQGHVAVPVDDKGSFRSAMLTPGEYDMLVTDPDYGAIVRTVRISLDSGPEEVCFGTPGTWRLKCPSVVSRGTDIVVLKKDGVWCADVYVAAGASSDVMVQPGQYEVALWPKGEAPCVMKTTIVANTPVLCVLETTAGRIVVAEYVVAGSDSRMVRLSWRREECGTKLDSGWFLARPGEHRMARVLAEGRYAIDIESVRGARATTGLASSGDQTVRLTLPEDGVSFR